jgi:hypothetical protein
VSWLNFVVIGIGTLGIYYAVLQYDERRRRHEQQTQGGGGPGWWIGWAISAFPTPIGRLLYFVLSVGIVALGIIAR